MTATEQEHRTMALMALRTGLRIGELLALRWQDIDLVAQKVMVRRSLWKTTLGTPKNGRSREVPLSDGMAQQLKRHRHLKSDLVFCRADGSMYTRDAIKRVLPFACKRAGLREVQWHVLRHSFASQLVMAGIPLKVVQELLGHATIEMTMRYSHLSPSLHVDAVAKLDTFAVAGSGRTDTISR